MKKFPLRIAAACLAAFLVVPAGAMEYTFDAPADYLFAQSTSDSTIYEWENPNVDRSKNVAVAAPGFGTPTSYLTFSGEYLTGNLVVSQQIGTGVAAIGSVVTIAPDTANTVAAASGGTNTTPPSVAGTGNSVTVGFTEVTQDWYYPNGSLGTLKIPSIGLTVGVYEGTDSAPLLKGAGHFTGTSIWAGNVPLAGHNRGVRNDFGKIHTLKSGDIITFTTALGTRTYAVSSVTKVSVNDTSGLTATAENCITLYTCVEDQPAYRWCVRAVETV